MDLNSVVNRTLWCFGDSNTYGYDPHGFFGGRYEAPWPALLAGKTGANVINDGMNGRTIPSMGYAFSMFQRDRERYRADMLIVMLGTNDLLEGAKAGESAARMEAFIAGCETPRILLLSPPPMKRGAWVGDDGLVEESRELARRYRALAQRLGLLYADTGEWNIELTYDGVHFSEEGHFRFADELAAFLYRMEGLT